MPRLRRVGCSMPGITRRKAGRGFYYVDAPGRKVRDPGEHPLDRTRVMAAAVRLLDLDPLVADVVRELKGCRGRSRRLLVYRRGRRWVEITSDDINAHIQEVTGGDFTAKEFRTWSATVLAAVAPGGVVRGHLSQRPQARRGPGHEGGGAYLGNTPAVARASYVDPRVVDLYNHGVTVKGALGRIGTAPPAAEAVGTGGEAGGAGMPGALAIQGAVERAVLRMISDAAESTGEGHTRRRAA